MSNLGYFFLRKKKTILVIIMALSHLALTILFAILGIKFLSIYNAISTAFYALTLIYHNQISDYILILSVAIEIPIYSIVATSFMGNNSGTLLYPFSMLMGVFLYSVNESYSVKKYLLTSIPCIIAILLITIWPFPQILQDDTFKTLIYMNKLFSSIIAISCIIYLCISINQDLVISNKKNAKYIEKLRFMSNYDPLTKILNRRSTMKKLENINVYTLVMFDIDDFKKFNDTYGHEAGDEILVELCNRISKTLPENAIFSRWGGEEFIIIFPDHSDQSILKITELCSVVNGTPFKLKTVTTPISITGGVSLSKPGLPFEKVFSEADSLLYIGKGNGKNQIVFPKS
mgnify:CR=1 FL=1